MVEVGGDTGWIWDIGSTELADAGGREKWKSSNGHLRLVTVCVEREHAQERDY